PLYGKLIKILSIDRDSLNLLPTFLMGAKSLPQPPLAYIRKVGNKFKLSLSIDNIFMSFP
ncbi:MAG: hypothetical protein AAFO59_12515, partial [Cyanobacteria bacterium J06607_17]